MVKATPADAPRPRGELRRDYVSCGVCLRRVNYSESCSTRAHARAVARMMAYRYVEAFGFVCRGCVQEIPELADPRARYRDPGPKASGPKRVKVQLSMIFDD